MMPKKLTKVCTKCGQRKYLRSFYMRKIKSKRRDGTTVIRYQPDSRCKSCWAITYRENVLRKRKEDVLQHNQN